MLVLAVIIAGDGARTDIGASANLGIADVAEVIDLCAFADPGFLDFTKIADLGLGANSAPGLSLAKGPIWAWAPTVVPSRWLKACMTALSPTRTPGPNQTPGSMVTSLPSSVSNER
jgi:hypothetical protein